MIRAALVGVAVAMSVIVTAALVGLYADHHPQRKDHPWPTAR